MTSYAVKELCEGWHTKGGVVGGIDLPVGADAIAGVNTRIYLKRHLVPCVLHSDKASREGETF